MDKETEEKIGQLQMLEQNLQQSLMQRQQFTAQLSEVETALKELTATDTSYRIIGNIMVKTEKPELEKDLKEKKEMIDVRIKSLESQENKMKEKAQKLQKEILGKIKKE